MTLGVKPLLFCKFRLNFSTLFFQTYLIWSIKEGSLFVSLTILEIMLTFILKASGDNK